MDKRTLILVFALTITFYIVNSFFESQRTEELQEWTTQNQARKEQEARTLQQEITEQTVNASELPIVEIYSDIEGENFLTDGIFANGTIMTLSWDKNLPNHVYGRKAKTDNRLEKYNLSFTPHQPNAPAMFQKGEGHKMPIGSLPFFGKYPVQIVSIFPKDLAKGFEVTPGTYFDGRLVLPENQLEQLKAEINREYSPKTITIPTNAIVLTESEGKFLPVGLFLKDDQSMVYLEQVEGFASLTTKPSIKASTTQGDEKFYVLENEYQQIVFSNKGGSIAEINLPFDGEKNPDSVVKEIEFDRDMVEDHPYNALFPGNPYFTPGKTAQGPFAEHAEGKLGGYYPLIRRSLILAQNRETINVMPRYYALNIVSEYPEMAELIFEVKHFDDTKIVFEAKQRHRRITKTFTLPKDQTGAPYVMDLTIQVEGDSRGLWLTTGVPEAEWISNASNPVLKYRVTRNQKSSVEKIKLPDESTTIMSEYPDWVTASNGFLGLILDPLTKIDPGYRAQYVSGTTVPSRLIEIDQEYDRFQAKKLPGYMLMLPLNGSGGTMKFRLFAGPFATNLLNQIDTFYSDKLTNYTPDYIASQTSHGWFTFISAPFSKLLWFLMNMFHSLTNSWGLSIILLTVALRLMLYPLNAWSAKSMLRMQEVQPEMTAIQERYKNKDQKQMQMEIMNLYRDKGVNPLSGCFPLLIQMPFLIGMFDLLKSTFELRGAVFIPGWINNLAAPDVLFSWEYPLPLIGNEFHLLPILSGLVMFVQQRMMSTAPKDPSLMTDQQRQQKTMGTFMALFLIVIFYNFPSGLNIYFLSSSLLGILQQWITKKTMKPTVAKKGTLEVLPKAKKKKAKSR